MTRKEIIVKILKDKKSPITTNNIVNIIYDKYSFIVENKRKYYTENNKEKTEKQIRQQLHAEIGSFIHQNLQKEIITIKINKKNHHILTENYDYNENYATSAEIINGKIDNYNYDYNDETDEKLDQIRKKKETIKVEIEREIVYQMTCEELDWKCLTIYKDDEHLDYEITPIKEYTYVFDGNNTLIKLGKTSQETPIVRLNGLKTANPAINVAIVFPATLYKEKYLHETFDDYRQQNNREWFFKSKKLLAFIAEHKAKNDQALEWYYKQRDIKDIENKIINW
jgi:hypothetical protein